MWGDSGGRDKETQVLRLSRVERHRLLVGPRRERRPDPRRGLGRKSWAGGLSSRTGLRCQGPAEQSPDAAGRRREGLALPLPAHLWHRQNKGWEGKQEEILTGKAGRNPNRDLGAKATSANRGSPRYCWSGAGKQGPACWPSLSQPLPHRTHSATRRSSAPFPSPAAPSSQTLWRSSGRLPLAAYFSCEREFWRAPPFAAGTAPPTPTGHAHK